MKKFYLFIFAIMFASLVFVSCTDNTYNLAKDNISEIRKNILTYKDNSVYVTFMSGKRESNYQLDGFSTESIDFAVINLDIIDENYGYNEKKVSYSLNINGQEFAGEMLNNPYDNSFVADLQINATDLTSCEIKFVIDNRTIVCNLTTITSGWVIDGYKALEIVCDDIKDYLKQHISDNILNSEVFIKVVYNEKYSNEYFWYIQFITTNGNKYTEIINPISGEILAKNIS